MFSFASWHSTCPLPPRHQAVLPLELCIGHTLKTMSIAARRIQQGSSATQRVSSNRELGSKAPGLGWGRRGVFVLAAALSWLDHEGHRQSSLTSTPAPFKNSAINRFFSSFWFVF